MICIYIYIYVYVYVYAYIKPEAETCLEVIAGRCADAGDGRDVATP